MRGTGEPQGAGNSSRIAGEMLDASGGGIAIRLPIHVTPGLLLRIDAEETMILGEVCYCQPISTHPGSYRLGVLVEHWLGDSPLKQVRETTLA